MKDTTLPSLKKMRFPAYRTIRRGVRIGEDDVKIKQGFTDVMIDQIRIKNYRDYFGFSHEYPFTYMYILAQRAQLAVMVNKEFPIAIPGLIHLSNHLETFGELKFENPFEIEVEVNIESKSTGSLYPNFIVNFIQDGNQVAKCSSGYLAKRKNKSKTSNQRKKNDDIPEISSSNPSEMWELSKSLGKTYGKVSGDSNPIHTSKLFAKFAGFKRPIIQGWYSVSRVVHSLSNIVENLNGVSVNFVNPIFLPSTVQLDFAKEGDNSYFYKVTTPNSKLTHLYGQIYY